VVLANLYWYSAKLLMEILLRRGARTKWDI